MAKYTVYFELQIEVESETDRDAEGYAFAELWNMPHGELKEKILKRLKYCGCVADRQKKLFEETRQ